MEYSSSTKKYWQIISEKQKILAITNGHRILRKAAQKQLQILKEQETNSNFPKSPRHHFIFNITKTFWKEADFAIFLKKSKWDIYAVYPVRTMMEKMIKTSHFLKLNTTEQDDLVQKELLLASKRSYDMQKATGNDTKETEDIYNSLNSLSSKKYPPITIVSTKKDLNTFPPYEQLCKTDKDYHYYRWLSGVPHGQLGPVMFLKVTEETEYKRIMMLANLLCYEMLTLTDHYLDGTTKLIVSEAIKKARKLITG